VTVTGASPIVDTSTTQLGTNFTKELLTEIPNARDIWAAMAQAPGIQMTGFDVGGSNTGVQTGFRSYGFDTQNQTRLEGIDTTEGTAANAGYFDFGSFEEFQVGGAGSDASAFAGGAVLSISVKSGGDRFTGNWYSDYLGESTISDNVPDYLQTSRTPNEDGFFVRNALERGNPVKKQYDINFNVGGPIVKQRAWFPPLGRCQCLCGQHYGGEPDDRFFRQNHRPGQPGHRLTDRHDPIRDHQHWLDQWRFCHSE
jgi:hypothetical protein